MSTSRNSAGGDFRHQPARLCILRCDEQRTLERVACSHRVAVVEQIARQQQPGLRGAPARQTLRISALALEGGNRLSQLAERALFVTALGRRERVVAHRINQQDTRITGRQLPRPLEILAGTVAGERRKAATDLLRGGDRKSTRLNSSHMSIS